VVGVGVSLKELSENEFEGSIPTYNITLTSVTEKK